MEGTNKFEEGKTNEEENDVPESETEDGFDMQMGTNHFGHFLFTEMVMPLIRKSAASGHHPR